MLKEYFDRKRAKIPMKDEEDVNGKIAVITGCNTGIGQVTAFELANRGAVVVMACRDLNKAQIAKDDMLRKAPNSQLELVQLDLEDLESIRRCAIEIKARVPHINILIANAGVMYLESSVRKSKECFEIHMGVNHLGHFLFINLLQDHLLKGVPGKIIVVSSVNYKGAKLDLDDIMLEKQEIVDEQLGYSNSKLANMYFAKSLGKKLEGKGINVYALCPGLVQTNLSRNGIGFKQWLLFKISYALAGLTCEQGAETILYCALSKKCSEHTGKMYNFNAVWDNTIDTLDEIKAEIFWRKSAELVGLKETI